MHPALVLAGLAVAIMLVAWLTDGSQRIGGLALGGLFVAGYLLLRSRTRRAHDESGKFFEDAGEETRLTSIQSPSELAPDDPGPPRPGQPPKSPR